MTDWVSVFQVNSIAVVTDWVCSRSTVLLWWLIECVPGQQYCCGDWLSECVPGQQYCCGDWLSECVPGQQYSATRCWTLGLRQQCQAGGAVWKDGLVLWWQIQEAGFIVRSVQTCSGVSCMELKALWSGSKPQLEVIFFLCCFGTGQNLCSCWKPSLLKGVLKQRHELTWKCRKCGNIFICRLHVSSNLLFSVSVYRLVNNTDNVCLSCAHQCPKHSHINLNTVFYTHIEHSPTKTIYIR